MPTFMNAVCNIMVLIALNHSLIRCILVKPCSTAYENSIFYLSQNIDRCNVFVRLTQSGIHPAILKLGLQYAEGVICGSNARCMALLAALKQVS